MAKAPRPLRGAERPARPKTRQPRGANRGLSALPPQPAALPLWQKKIPLTVSGFAPIHLSPKLGERSGRPWLDRHSPPQKK